MFITAYSALIDPVMGRIPVEECIEAWEPYVDAFVFIDASRYDKVDLSRYGKVKKHIKTILPVHDNPFGSLFTQAFHLVDSDTSLFLDLDELPLFGTPLKDIVRRYDLNQFAGIAFPLKNYYCDRHHILDGCQTKGSHVFKTSHNIIHDFPVGTWQPTNSIRRHTTRCDVSDGVRVCNQSGNPMPHYPVVSPDDILVHHTSHLDPYGKMVRSFLQFSHTSVIDLKGFYGFDMRITPEIAKKIYDIGEEEIKNGDVDLWTKPLEAEYTPFPLLEKYIERCNIKEFRPQEMKSYSKFA